jgi:fatty acid-binding protein DegV
MQTHNRTEETTETGAQTTNGSFQTDVSALQEATERAVEILDSHGEPVTIPRLVGTVVRLGGQGDHRFETVVRVAQQYTDEECGGADQ